MDNANSTTAIQRFEFHGDSVSTLKDESTGKVYCVPREISQSLGLTWPGQHAKLTQGKIYQGHTLRMDIVTQGQAHETLVLDIDLLPTWLFSVAPERVKEAVREKLVRYQRETSQAIRDYWFTGSAHQPSVIDRYPELQAIVKLTQSIAETRLLAEQADAKADRLEMRAAHTEETLTQANAEIARAHAEIDRLHESQSFFTVAEYVLEHDLKRQIPESAYRACSDHLLAYCLEHGIRTREQPIGGKPWKKEHSYHVSVYAAAFEPWLKRYAGQISLRSVSPIDKKIRG